MLPSVAGEAQLPRLLEEDAQFPIELRRCRPQWRVGDWDGEGGDLGQGKGGDYIQQNNLRSRRGNEERS